MILEVVVKLLGGLHGGPVVQLVAGRAARKVRLEGRLHWIHSPETQGQHLPANLLVQGVQIAPEIQIFAKK